MKDKMFVIGKVIGIIVFILALSMMGMASGKPIMVLGYAGFFVAVMFLIFLFVRKNQRHFEIISQTNPKLLKIVGGVILLIAIAFPVIIIMNIQIFDMSAIKISLGFITLLVAITIALIACGVFAVNMINREKATKISRALGYLIIIVLSAVPALLVMPYDRTTTGIGSVYYITLLVSVLSWWGITLYLNKD